LAKIDLSPVYEDKTVYIIGGGPSIEETDFTPLHDKPCIGVNCAFNLGTWIDIIFFGDCRTYTWHEDKFEQWPNRIITKCATLKNHPKIEYIPSCDRHNLCLNHNKVAWPDGNNRGANSGSASINLAIHLGATKIILVGFDMKKQGDKHNYHDLYQDKHTPRDDVYNRFQRHFLNIAKETNIEIMNANPNSALKAFPKDKLENLI